MRIHKLCYILIIAVLTVSGAAYAQLGPSKPIVSSKTVLSVDRVRPGDNFQMAVRATVQKGYHVGAHDKDALYPAKLTIQAPKGVTFDEPQFPPAKHISLKFAGGEKIPVYEGNFVVKVKGHVAQNMKPGKAVITTILDTQGCKADQCFPPSKSRSTVALNVVARGTKVSSINAPTFAGTAGSAAAGMTADQAMASRLANMNIFVRFLFLYMGGLLLAFTPCVYPMIPVTLGYFSNQSGEQKSRNKVLLLAGAYVLGLALTYSILGAIAATTGGMFGAAMQSPGVLVGVAAILVLLALSMFGVYELQAPSFIQSRASGKSGVFGALGMGLVFGIVAAPCVGPVVLGLMLFAARLGSPAMGFLMFFALALGIGTPLFFLAAFSAKMPVPGMWMIAIKKIAGFLLIGAAAYFVMPLIPGPFGRFLIPAVVVAAGIYLGCFEASIRSSKLAAGFSKAFCVTALAVAAVMAVGHADGSSMQWEHYRPALVAKAIQSHKPVMIDFTAAWCGACKELEHGPFSDPNVIKATGGFTKFRVDGTNQDDPTVIAAAKKYAVKGFPAVIFIDSSGREVRSARVVSFVDSREMMKRVEMVK